MTTPTPEELEKKLQEYTVDVKANRYNIQAAVDALNKLQLHTERLTLDAAIADQKPQGPHPTFRLRLNQHQIDITQSHNGLTYSSDTLSQQQLCKIALGLTFQLSHDKAFTLNYSGPGSLKDNQAIFLQEVAEMMARDSDFRQFVELGNLSYAEGGQTLQVNLQPDGKPIFSNKPQQEQARVLPAAFRVPGTSNTPRNEKK